MKAIWQGLSSVMCALLMSTPLMAAVSPGDMAPDFTLTGSDGQSHTLSDYKGKYVILEWTNHDCPFVRKHYDSGNMQALQKEYTARDVIWLSMISSAPGKQGYVDAEQANELTQSRDAAPTAVLFDPEGTVGKAYGAKTTPHMYIIAPDGKLVYMGGIDDTPSANVADIEEATNYIKVAMTELMADQPVSSAATRPYGCSVKY